jgi:hypothetical protein
LGATAGHRFLSERNRTTWNRIPSVFGLPTGELPLLDLLDAVPRDLVIGLEVPIRSQAQAGLGPHERLSQCVAAARGLLAQLADRGEGAQG